LNKVELYTNVYLNSSGAKLNRELKKSMLSFPYTFIFHVLYINNNINALRGKTKDDRAMGQVKNIFKHLPYVLLSKILVFSSRAASGNLPVVDPKGREKIRKGKKKMSEGAPR